MKHHLFHLFTHILYRIPHILYPFDFRDSFVDSIDNVSHSKPILLTKRKKQALQIFRLIYLQKQKYEIKKKLKNENTTSTRGSNVVFDVGIYYKYDFHFSIIKHSNIIK